MVPTRALPRALSSPLCLVLNTPGPLFPPIWNSMHSPTPSATIIGRFLGPHETLRSLKTMLAPTRERDLAKIMISLLSCFWVRFLALWRVSQGGFGRHLASPRELLGGLGRLMGALGALLGCYLAHVGALGRSVGAHELSWGTLEAVLGLSWRVLGPSWANPTSGGRRITGRASR